MRVVSMVGKMAAWKDGAMVVQMVEKLAVSKAVLKAEWMVDLMVEELAF